MAERTTDISYCSDHEGYPDTYFDLYRSSANAGQMHPVFVYVHGGGYVSGSKDPLDTSCMGPGVEALFEGLLSSGCDVVSMEYTLAPAGRYPTPVEELALLMVHLRAHADEHGLDMQRVAVGGGSAGGQIAGQYAALVTSEAYRKDFLARVVGSEHTGGKHEQAIETELENGSVKAVYLGCALLDPKRFARTGDTATDAKFAWMQLAYFAPWAAFAESGEPIELPTAEDDQQFVELLEEANVTAHVTKDFPPTYLTDGNHLTFDDQTRELDAKLAKLGVEHEARIAGADAGEVPHGYDVQDRDDARENARAAAEFICAHV